MKSLLAVLFAAGLAAAAGVAAADPGITVYTWTDAAGVTHFSDKAPANGAARTLHLPTPAPPDRTAQAANAAWLAQTNRDEQQRLAREAELRLAEARAAAQTVQIQPYPQYVPVYFGYGPRRFHRHRFNDHDRDDRGFGHRTLPPIASFPQYQLPSSFPVNRTLPPARPDGR